ncbi:MAG TPA: hypothetical protein VKP65_05165, partial [Rhodothermales bacterium]|nr:hypothetical protein [Rhodothermales bacterium]
AQPSTFFTRRAYERIGGIDPALHYVMDWDLWCRFAQAGCTFYFINEVLSAARTYPDTKTSGGGSTRLAEILRLNRRYKSTPWPLAATAHAYHDLIASRWPYMHALLRHLWRTLARKRFMTPSLVHGLAFPDQIPATPARVHFPHYGNLARVLLYLDHAQENLPLRATLNGRAGVRHHTTKGTGFTWDFSSLQYVAEVDLEIHLNSTQPHSDIRLRKVILQK